MLLIVASFGSEIKKYEITMHLNKNGVLTVTEVIYYLFDKNGIHHGIYRDIPLKIKQGHDLYFLPFSNLRVLQDDRNVSFSEKIIDKSSYYMHIEIGSKEKRVRGLHKYTINYDTMLPTFPAGNSYEVISINAIGTWWKVPIEKAFFTLHIPKNLSKNLVKTKSYTGYYHSVTSNAFINWEDNNTIKIIVKDLEPYEGLTVDLYFPKGTIVSTLKKVPFFKRFWYWFLLIPMVLYLFYISKDYLHKSDAPLLVRYNPPENLSVLQSALLYDATMSNITYAAAIIELANRGKITIKYKDNTTFLYVKNKDISELNSDLQMFFNELFREKNIIIIKDEDRDTKEYLEKTFKKIDEYLDKLEVENGLVSKSFRSVKNRFILKALLVFLPLFSYTIYDTVEHFKTYGVYIAIFGPYFIAVITIILLKLKTFGELVIAIFTFLLLVFMLVNYGSGWKEFLLGPIGVLLIFSFIWTVFYAKIADYTEKGIQEKNYLEGLKEFIKRAKKDQIATFLKEDPLFLDKLLPYAMIFGVSNHWLKYYEIFDTEPFWFDGNSIAFSSFYSNFGDTVDSTTSGGVGGFSGGGALGGGGGDW